MKSDKIGERTSKKKHHTTMPLEPPRNGLFDKNHRKNKSVCCSRVSEAQNKVTRYMGLNRITQHQKMMIALPIVIVKTTNEWWYSMKKKQNKKGATKKRLYYGLTKKTRPFRFGFGVNHRWVRLHVFLCQVKCVYVIRLYVLFSVWFSVSFTVSHRIIIIITLSHMWEIAI